jgi:hypothetical protein
MNGISLSEKSEIKSQIKSDIKSEIKSVRPYKIKKNTYLIKDTLNAYFSDFLLKFNQPELLQAWNGLEEQTSFNKLLCENKMKMKDRVAEQKRKEEKKRRIIEREATKQAKRVEKAQSKPKTPFYFFKKEEEEKIKKENVKIVKKDLYTELQKRWKEIKGTEKYGYYKEQAEKNQPYVKLDVKDDIKKGYKVISKLNINAKEYKPRIPSFMT